MIAYRDQLDASGYRPGTSEFLDLLTVIAVEQKESELSDEALKDIVDKMGEYLVKKTFAADTLLY